MNNNSAEILASVKVENPTEYGSVKRANETLSFQNNAVLLAPGEYGGYVSPMGIFNMKASKWKLNYANSKTGDGEDYNINITQIPKLWCDTETCNAMLTQIKINESKAQIPEVMKEVINYLPQEMDAGKGLTAIQLAKEYSYELCTKAVEGLIKEGKRPSNKYAEKNLHQANVLRYATLCVNAQKFQFKGKSFAEIVNLEINEMKKQVSMIMNAESSLEPFVKDLLKFITVNMKAGNDVRKSLLLNLGNMESGASYVLLDEFKTPNNKKLDKNGLTEGKAVKIVCHFGAEYPYHITIESMKGKPSQGQVGMSRKDAKDYKTFTFKMLEWEWTYALSQEKSLLDGLVYTNANRACQIAAYLNNKNMAVRKKAAG